MGLLLPPMILLWGSAHALWRPARRPLNDEDRIALGALEETVLVARILDTFEGVEGGLMHRRLVLDVREVLRGKWKLGRCVGEFGSVAEFPWNNRMNGFRGRWAVVFPLVRGGIILLRYGPELPGDGVLIVAGPTDPAIERLRLAMRRATLDSLIARAEVICIGGPIPRRLKRADHLLVKEWVAGPGRCDTLSMFWPWAVAPKSERVLLFLARNPSGRLEPLGMGAGELIVENGRVPEIDRSLAEVLTQIRARRFVQDARNSRSKSTSTTH